MVIGEKLDLDVARIHDAALEIHRGVAERRAGLGPRRPDRIQELARRPDDAHALAAAAGHGLDHQRVADARALARDLIVGRGGAERRVGARDQKHTRAQRDSARTGLAPHQLDGLWCRADKSQARIAARSREGGVLRKEAVAGMDGVRPGRSGGVDQLVDAEIAL